MSTLKDTLVQRRMEEPDAGHPCYSANAEASTLLVEASNGENWLLPWQHFLEGRQKTADGCERLVLTFATQEVAVVGKNLGVLVDEIAHLRLEGVRPAPGKYQKSSSADAFVAKIEVRSRADKDARE
jgi:hypothetical protein